MNTIPADPCVCRHADHHMKHPANTLSEWPDSDPTQMLPAEIPGFVDWMFEQGIQRSDLVYALEKPWKHSDWLASFRRGLTLEDQTDSAAAVVSLRRAAAVLH